MSRARSKEECSEVPFSGPVSFRGSEYPSNFQFISQYENGSEPEEGTVVGLAVAYLRSLKTGEISDIDQLLVWSGGSVIAVSKKRYRKNGWHR